MTITQFPTFEVQYYGDRTAASLPPLDVATVYRLIEWAQLDDAIGANLSAYMIAAMNKFDGWGRWNQGSWAVTGLEVDAQGEANPDELLSDLDVQTWRNGECQTAYCMAGQVVHQNNYRMIYSEGDDGDGHSASFCILQEPTGERNAKGLPVMRDVPGAGRELISNVAARLLGLTEMEADAFFEGDNGVGTLQRLANTFAAARGMPILFDDAGISQYEFEPHYRLVSATDDDLF